MCTTELGRAAKLAPEFAKRNVKMIALSVDSVEDHLAWSKVRYCVPGLSAGAACGVSKGMRMSVCAKPSTGW